MENELLRLREQLLQGGSDVGQSCPRAVGRQCASESQNSPLFCHDRLISSSMKCTFQRPHRPAGSHSDESWCFVSCLAHLTQNRNIIQQATDYPKHIVPTEQF